MTAAASPAVSATMLAAAMARHIALWNAVIPRCACETEVGETHTRYLHPRKGWRRVANRRLGL